MKFIVLNLIFLLFTTSACLKDTIQPNNEKHLLENPNSLNPTSYEATDDSHMLLGNPDDSKPSEQFPNKYLIDKTYYWVSYNNSTHIPNWVSWHLDASYLGSIERNKSFKSESTLPAKWSVIKSADYLNSGFDRGHNCPSADRTNSYESNLSTFSMANIIPQAPNNNRKTWANFEDYTRTLIKAKNEAFIIMGSYGSGGTGTLGFYKSINDAHTPITVPNRIWKVVVILPDGSNDLKRITSDTRVIAIDTPNDQALNTDWRHYRTSVDAIEHATGYNIMNNIPAAIQDIIEAKVDNL